MNVQGAVLALFFGDEIPISLAGDIAAVVGVPAAVGALEPWGGVACHPETTQGKIDGSFSQIPFKCYLPEVASVGD